MKYSILTFARLDAFVPTVSTCFWDDEKTGQIINSWGCIKILTTLFYRWHTANCLASQIALLKKVANELSVWALSVGATGASWMFPCLAEPNRKSVNFNRKEARRSDIDETGLQINYMWKWFSILWQNWEPFPLLLCRICSIALKSSTSSFWKRIST